MAQDVGYLIGGVKKRSRLSSCSLRCLKNQEILARSAFVAACRRMIGANFRNGSQNDVKELKANTVKALASLLEGRNDTLVHKSLVDRLDPTVVKKRMMVVHDEFLEQEAEHLGDNQWDEEFLDEGFDLLTLAVELGNADETFAEVVSGDVGRRPRDDAFRDPKARLEAMKAYEMQLQYHEARDFFEKKVRSVEIKWNNELSRIFFPKPSECEFLSDETKERINCHLWFP